MTSFSILPVTDDDLPFLQQMLRAAACWRDLAAAPPVSELLRDPTLAVYVAGWGRPGDTGLVARIGEHRCGAVWARRWAGHVRGYGYVDDDSPELSIAVAAEHRGQGIGRSLLTALLAALQLDGVTQVSLSVEAENPAVALYTQLGFETWAAGQGDLTMVRRLRRGAGHG